MPSQELHGCLHIKRLCKVSEARWASIVLLPDSNLNQSGKKLILARPFSALKAPVHVDYNAGIK